MRGSILMLVALVAMAGCQTDRIVSSDGRPLPDKPRAAPPAPQTAPVNRMVLMVGSKPEDTNRSGYPDLIRATVALFATPHPTAVRRDGTFLFELHPHGRSHHPDTPPIAQWRIEGEALERARARAQWGPAYLFTLSLTEQGVEQQPLSAADLRCTFIPADGSRPVRSDGVRSIQIGRRHAAH